MDYLWYLAIIYPIISGIVSDYVCSESALKTASPLADTLGCWVRNDTRAREPSKFSERPLLLLLLLLTSSHALHFYLFRLAFTVVAIPPQLLGERRYRLLHRDIYVPATALEIVTEESDGRVFIRVTGIDRDTLFCIQRDKK